MEFKEYERLIEKTAIYPGKGDNIFYPALGLTGEAGEVAEKVKKIVRDKNSMPSFEDKAEIAKELGDVLWYVTAMALEIEYTLEEVAKRNIDKLLSRRDRGALGGSGDNR